MRINQQIANGSWSPSATFSFFANGCGAVAAVVIAPPLATLAPTVNLIKCNDGTKSEILGSATCAGHGGISSKVTQPQVYTPYGGMIGNNIPVGQTGAYVPYNGAPGTSRTTTGFTVCANGTISTNCTSAGGAATTTSSLGPPLT